MQISGVTELLRQIEQEYEAAQWGLTGYAAVARHDIISAHMDRIQQHHLALQELVGEQEAIELIAGTLERF